MLYHTIPTFDDPEGRLLFENIVGKGENAGYQHFLLFPQFFSTPSNRQVHVRVNMLWKWTRINLVLWQRVKKTNRSFKSQTKYRQWGLLNVNTVRYNSMSNDKVGRRNLKILWEN